MTHFEAALSYVKRGWYVFPVRLDKTPATPKGFNDASCQESKVRGWWSTLEDVDEFFGIGIATGMSNLLVLDFDVKAGGLETLRELHIRHPEINDTMQVATGGGGYHFYFTLPPGTNLPSRVKLLPGMDVRSSGGYVVAAPSPHLSGRCYKLINPNEPRPCPEWVMDLFKKRNEPIAAPSDGSFVMEGGRNDYLARMAGSMRRKGFSDTAVLFAITQENLDHCHPPLPDSEVRRIVANINRYSPNDPESLKQADYVEPSGIVVNYWDLVPETLLYLKDKHLVKGEPTGLEDFDNLLGGGKRLGEVTVTHAEAKTGKNTFWHKQMYLWLERGIPIAYASRELSPATEVIPDLWSIHFQHNARLEDITPGMEEKYRTPKWPLYFSNGYGYFPLEELFEWVEKLKAQGVQYFWFDHLHYMIEDPEDHKAASKLIKQIKTLAKVENIHIDIIIQPKLLEDGQKLSLSSIKGGAAMGQALDNLVVLERYKCDTPNIMRLELKAGRSKLAKLGECFFQYNPTTVDMVAVVPVKAAVTGNIGAPLTEMLPLQEKSIRFEDD